MWGCYRRVEEITETIKYLRNKIINLRSKQGLKATVFDKEIVSGGTRANTQESLSLAICECELEIERLEIELNIELNHINKMESIAKEYGDNTMAVIKLKAQGLYNWEVAEELGLSQRTIDRYIKKIKG
jgi:ATP/maltotriose-dependent transcriptional regulator MalT